MNKNLKRHKLLGILSEQSLRVDLDQASVLGVSFDELTDKLNCTKGQLLEFCALLFSEEEIGHHDTHNVKGLYAKPKGVSSYSIKKYKRENEKIIFERAKNWVQTTIPILSLIVTILVIIISESRLEEKNSELRDIRGRLYEIEKNIIDLKKPDPLNSKTEQGLN